MSKLLLLRHLKSQWNRENRFTGWVDVPLDENETSKAKELADRVFKIQIDKIYTSPLFRNEDTVARLFEELRSSHASAKASAFEGSIKYPIFIHLDGGRMQKWAHYADLTENDVPVLVSEALNERYYGKFQGENKEAAMQKYGQEQVRLWRRSFKVAPPGGESLKDVMKRTIPFYRKYVEKDLREGKNVLIVASHNSLRSIAKYVEKISDEDIINYEIDYGGLIEYELDESLNLKNKTIS
jgi:2,3-bisphosphoglycerate-dependent phosphoglycerate mutase